MWVTHNIIHNELGIISHMLDMGHQIQIQLKQYTDKPIGIINVLFTEIDRQIEIVSNDLYHIFGAPDIATGSFGNL